MIRNKSKPSMVVFTAWPDLVKDQYNQFELKFKESCENIIQKTFASNEVSANFMRYVTWVHDQNYYADFEYCLFVRAPVQIELSDFLCNLDEAHTTYTDIDQEVIMYKRNKPWQIKIIETEKSPAGVGVIFIDCWQQIADKSRWIGQSDYFDFYINMQNHLSKYQIKTKVFHTGTYGDLELSNELLPWSTHSNSKNIMYLEEFQAYYKEKDVRSWIVVGAHWQSCTHDKPLGFRNLLELKKHDPELKIYSHKDCTIKFVNNDIEHPVVSTLVPADYEQDSLIWKPNGNLFELVTE